jgi:N-acetyl-gamma-glutamyl-phosphate reductase
MIKVGIVGSSGYVAGELIRTLVHHPEAQIDFIYSHSMPGQKACDVHQDLMTHPNLTLTDKVNLDVGVLFLCLGHGNSVKFLSENKFAKHTKVIDLGNDFRLNKDAHYEGNNFIYGLVETNKAEIEQATHIANPGCFATAIQLAILPLAKSGLLDNDLHINAITGSTGAGKSLSETTHFSWRNNNVSHYKAFQHQHLGEITETVVKLQSGFDNEINFMPVRGDFTRGIFATAYFNSDIAEKALLKLYKDYYENAAFTFVTDRPVHLKQVVNTNNCFLQVQKIDNKVLITSVIDNLLKGAAGQAIQNMNLMHGIDETTGLNLKSTSF